MKKSSKSKAKKRAGRSLGQKKISRDGHIKLNEIWPQERDFMQRPERYKYVRKMIQDEGCVFCSAAKEAHAKGAEFSNLVLCRSEFAMVVMNKYPYNTGHILVLPTRHIGKYDELKDQEAQELHSFLRQSIELVQKAYNCDGLNSGINLGKVSGAGIPDHLHWHIIPRWAGDTNFFPLIAETKVVPETLEQAYARLLPYFKDLKP